MTSKSLSIGLFAAVTVLASPAIAREKKQPSGPNKLICRTAQETGSRLATKKTCLTKTQWDQMERDQRMTVDRIQAYKPNQG